MLPLSALGRCDCPCIWPGHERNELCYPDGEPFSLSLWHLSFTSWIWILLRMGFSWYVYKSMNDHIGIFKLLDRWEQSIIQRKRKLERRMTEQEKRAIRGVDTFIGCVLPLGSGGHI